MDGEFKRITWSEVLAGLMVVLFGWGSLWAGREGARIAFERSPAEYNLAAAVRSAAAVSPAPALSSTPASVTVMIGGDIMLDRRIRFLGQTYGYDTLFASATPVLKTADIVVANLEGPVTSNPSETLSARGAYTKSFAFTFDPKSMAALVHAGFTALSLANNHSDNFGASGLAQTRAVLDENGLRWFGDPGNASSTETILEKNGIAVALVGYHAFEPGLERILADVRRLSNEGDFVIVMPHWGTEYAASSSESMKAAAQEFIAAGAGAVIGSHPHVVMDHEWMDGKPVFYSLGNLLFDQYFSPAVMKGAVVELHVTKGAAGTAVDRVDLYETSLAGHRGILISPVPRRIDKPYFF